MFNQNPNTIWRKAFPIITNTDLDFWIQPIATGKKGISNITVQKKLRESFKSLWVVQIDVLSWMFQAFYLQDIQGNFSFKSQ